MAIRQVRGFRCTSPGMFKQQLNLPPETYTLSLMWRQSFWTYWQLKIKYEDNSFLIIPVQGELYKYHFLEYTFVASKRIVEIDLCDTGTNANPTIILEPMLEYGTNASTSSPNPDDVTEEIEIVDGKYGEQIIELGNLITTTKEEFESQYWKKTTGEAYVDGVKTSVESDYNTKFTQTAASISSKAEKSVTDGLGNRLSEAESEIEQNATDIRSKVSQSEFDTLGNRVTTAESEIEQNATYIRSKVSQSEFDTLGNRVTTAESEIIQNATEISSKVSNSQMQSAISQKADEINLSVNNLKSDLAATGINIQQKEIVVTAPKFKVQKPNGDPLAIFDDNINIDNDGNMKLKSIRTPFAVVTPPFSNNIYTVNWKQTPQLVLTGLSNDGSITLPGTQDYDGIQLTIVWDAFWRGNAIAPDKRVDLKPYGAGKFYVNEFDEKTFIRLYTQCRHVIKIVGIWNSTSNVLDWVVEDFIDYSGKKTVIKAGELVCSGRINSDGTGTIVVNNYRGNWSFSKDGYSYFIQPLTVLRYSTAHVVETYQPNASSDLILNVNTGYLNQITGIYGNYGQYNSRFKIENYFVSSSGTVSSITAYIEFEIRARKDINQRFY